MPYINQKKRTELDSAIDELHNVIVKLQTDDEDDNMEGNLNYIITKLIRQCYNSSYRDINDAMGMLTCVMMEHYRTIAAPYENQKIFDNGDVEVTTKPEYLPEIVVSQEPTDDDCDSNEGC